MDKPKTQPDGLVTASVSIASLSISSSNRPDHLTPIQELASFRAIENTDSVGGATSTAIFLDAEDTLVPLTEKELEIVQRYKDQALWFSTNGHPEEAKVQERLAKQASTQYVYDSILDELILPEPEYSIDKDTKGNSITKQVKFGGYIAERKDVYTRIGGKDIKLFGKDGSVSNRIRNCREIASRLELIVENRQARATNNKGYQKAIANVVNHDNVVVNDYVEVLSVTKGDDGDYNAEANIPVKMHGVRAIAKDIAKKASLELDEQKMLGIA